MIFAKLLRGDIHKTMCIGQDCLNNLTLLSIEHELLRKIDVDDIIARFALNF